MLGPLLLLLYINDLCNMVEKCDTILYAEDTAVVGNVPDVYTAHIYVSTK